MPNRISINWWENCANESPWAIAFVDTKDKFIWVNNKWSQLTGYSRQELVGQKRWQDITVQEDVGSDQANTESIKDGEDLEYYLEKEYRKPDGTKVPVGIYVHRQPKYGLHEGYIVFAEKLSSAEIIGLKHAFNEMNATVTLLEHTSKCFERIDERVRANADKIESLEELLKILIGNMSNNKSINIGGDVTGQDKVGRDKNSIWNIIFVIIGIGIIVALLTDGQISFNKDSIEVNKPSQVEISN